MLRKFIYSLGIIIVSIGSVLIPERATAQTREKVIGIAGGFASYNSGGYTNLFFQYTFAPHIRIAPEIGYVFRNENKTGFEISADMHFPFQIARGFGIYPLVGFTFNNWISWR